MTGCSLRRLQEYAVTRGSGGEEKAATANDEGVGTREQLVRVPMEHSTMTSCSLRRLQETYPYRPVGRHVSTAVLPKRTHPARSMSLRTSPHEGSHFTGGCRMAENGSRG
jgi:hypothetical protein